LDEECCNEEKALISHYYMSLKVSAKTADPAQQHLRDSKKKWNKATSEFITRMIEFKNAMNGRGSSKYGLPTSNIKNPLPQEVVSFLSELSSNYQLIAEEALRITQEQAQYAQNRRKPKAKGPKVATASQKSGKVLIGDNVFDTELAISAEEQERGLMFVKEPKIMSFVYEQPVFNRFWMYNTPAPLDIIFSLDGKITNICKGEPFSTRLIGDYRPSDLVVEMPYGSCEKYGITTGHPIQLRLE